jgi:hypothetical protein
MAGCTPKDGTRVFLGYTGGVVASVAIMELAGVLASPLGQMAVPVAVLIIVVPVICAERVPMLNFVPAWFVGAGVFFGLKTLKGGEHVDAGLTTLCSCLWGLIYGWVTVLLRVKYEAWLKAKSPGGAPAEAPAETPPQE